MPNFQYHNRLQDQQIRLLRLLPGAWLDELKAEVHVADKSHKYVALSYVWGSSRRANGILLNGDLHPITFNLDRALRAIRKERESLVLWVDSICINQSDAIEKGHQVGLMHDIFGWATEVIAYLGDGLDRGDDDYPHRFDKLGYCPPVHLTGLPEEYEKLACNLWETPSNHPSEHKEILCMYSLILALHHGRDVTHGHLPNPSAISVNSQWLDRIVERIRLLARSDWWNRMWTIQEACAARKLSLLYGRVSIPFHFIPISARVALAPSGPPQESPSDSSPPPFEELVRILLYLGDKADSIDALRFRRTYSDLSHITTNSPLLWLLRNFRHRKSTEPRDKIYALLPLARDMAIHEKVFRQEDVAVKTDYNATVEALFSRVAHEIIRQTGLLWITTCDLLAKSRNDIPSWVPDWSSENPVHGFNLSRLRIQAEIYCKFNASRALFRHFDSTREENHRQEALYRPEEHYRYLATEDATTIKWEAVHRLPQTYVGGLRARAFMCDSVGYLSEPIRSDLSNIPDAIFQIIPREAPWLHKWQARNHGSFLDVVVRVLCSSMRIKHNHPKELLRDERRQAEYWMLHRFLERNLVDLTAYWEMYKNRVQWHFSEAALADEAAEAVEAAEAAIYAAKEAKAGQSVVWAHDDGKLTGRSWLSETIGNEVPLFTFSSGPDPKRAPDTYEAERDWSEDHSWIEDTLRATASGFRLFITRGGSVGLGPESMLHDDNIYIVEGGLMPYVLRGSRMMGTCYVEGIMRAGEVEGGIFGTDADNAEGLWMSLRDELMRKLGPIDVEERELCLS